MKKFIIVLLSFILVLPLTIVFALPASVGPDVFITGNLINNSSFYTYQNIGPDTVSLTFSYDNQEVVTAKANQTGGHAYKFYFDIIQNSYPNIYISYRSMDFSTNTQRLCQLSFHVDRNNYASVSEKDLEPELLHCMISGDPNKSDFTITMTDGWNNTLMSQRRKSPSEE